MKTTVQLPGAGDKTPESEGIFEKIIFGFCFSTAGAILGVFWGTAFTYSPYWLVVITSFGAVFGGLSQYNNAIGRILNNILCSFWAVSPVSYHQYLPSGLVVFVAIIFGLLTGILAALFILLDNYFWLEMSKHTHAAPPRLIAGAVLGLVVSFFQKNIRSMAKERQISISDEFVGAAQKNDIDRLSALFAAGASINSKEGVSDFTALMTAAFCGHIEIVRFLIAKRADVDKRENVGNSTALMVAAQEGHADIVSILIAAGAKINAENYNGVSAIGSATGRGHIDIVRALLSEGAEVNTTTVSGRTPLMMAADGGHIDTVKILLDNGADKTAKSHKRKTAAMYAKERGYSKIVELLKLKYQS